MPPQGVRCQSMPDVVDSLPDRSYRHRRQPLGPGQRHSGAGPARLDPAPAPPPSQEQEPMTDLKTGYKNFTIVYAENQDLWRCWELDVEAATLSALKRKIDV